MPVIDKSGTAIPSWPVEFKPAPLPADRLGDDLGASRIRNRGALKVCRTQLAGAGTWYETIRKGLKSGSMHALR